MDYIEASIQSITAPLQVQIINPTPTNPIIETADPTTLDLIHIQVTAVPPNIQVTVIDPTPVVPVQVSDIPVADWATYTMQWSQSPTVLAVTPNGIVMLYLLNNVIRYRFIPNPYDSHEDAFYQTYEDGVLSHLLVRRG